jgi:hypothetical protein
MLDLIQAPFPRLARMMESYWLKALAPAISLEDPGISR